MSAGAVFIMRRRTAGTPDSYRTWGYPVTPALFVAFSLYLVISSLVENPVDSLIGAGIILTGVPLYLYWKKR